MRFRDYSGTKQFRPLSAWAYYGYAVLFSIPIVGWIFLLIFTFSTKNYNRRSYARSYWCGLLVEVIIIGSLLAIAIGSGWLPEKVSALQEWIREESGMTSFTALPIARPVQNVGDAATEENQSPSDTSAKQAPVSSIDGVTPEFKKTMDELEALVDTYIEFMEDNEDGSVNITKMPKYLKTMTQVPKAMETLEQIEESIMTEADQRYYTEMMMRIEQKLATSPAAQ